MLRSTVLILSAALFFSGCSSEVAAPEDDAFETEASALTAGGGLGLHATATFSATIPSSQDPVDVYYPRTSRPAPVAVLLQGANVDKAQYASYATRVASFGFVVLVPNHARTTPPLTGLFASQEVVTQALDFAVAEGQSATSPLRGRVDGTRVALLGHSWGGVVGLFSVQGTCAPPFCTPGAYTRPAGLKAAVFFGTTLQQGPKLFPVDTSAAPVALVQGALDGKSIESTARASYAELEKPRAYVLLEGVNHYGVNEDNDPAGATPDPNAPTVSQKKSIARAALFTGLFLRAHVHGDRVSRWMLTRLGGAWPGVDVTTED